MAGPEPLTVRSGRIKKARRLATRAFRDKTGAFLAEGPQAVREALTVPDAVVEVFATSEALARWERAGEDRGEPAWTVVGTEVIEALAHTVNTQGIVAHCRRLDRPLAEVVDGARLVAVCVDIRDPGNAGTVIRCADAAGADAVVLAGRSVDPYNPKAVRASAGSLFHIPLAMETDVDAVITGLRSAGLRALAADAHGAVGLYDADARLAEPTAWLFGNEAHGLPDDLIARLDASVAIPIRGRAESLNLATAAAVCLYASAQAQS